MAKFTGAGYLVGLVLLICLITLDSRPTFSGEGKSDTGPGPVMPLPEKGEMLIGFNWPENPCHNFGETLKQQMISVWQPHIELFRSSSVNYANLGGIDINSDGYVDDIKIVKPDPDPYFNQSILGAIAQIKQFKRMPKEYSR